MKKTMKLMVLTLIATLLMVILSGCQKKEMTTYEEIIDSEKMTFAMTGAYPPFNFFNEDGELDGFDIDIAKALAAELGVSIDPITTDWDGIIGGLESGRFDMIIGSMAVTEERLERVNFTNPYYYDGANFFMPSETAVDDITHLEDASVGVVTGTTFHDYLETLDNIGEIMQFSSDVDNIMALEQGRMDGLVTTRFVGLRASELYDVDLEIVGDMLYAEDIAIAIRKDDIDLLDAMNVALASIIEKGIYAEISDKWFGANILEQ